ncbi:WG repeat-containing protein [Ekhidna sp. MALMAid0563]|uniref:WG repeat-containing protein n=1 Tax=Ekhidna sp. MALMAid0563 TaxID=3143937 RepID=UPI0032DFCB7B
MVKSLLYVILFPQLIVFGTVNRIQKAMEKKEYDKAYELIAKGYEKEPNNPGISYYHAKLFFDRDFSAYNIDTARVAIERSLETYENASAEIKDDLVADGVYHDQIKLLSEKIRDRTFQNTLNDLTIENILKYQRNYPQSVYEDILTFKKDSIEYDAAKSMQSQTALIDFISDHPTSVFRPKADSLLDLMRWQVLESSGTLKDYYSYLDRYPYSRHRKKVEEYILKVSTASHSTENYTSFISLSSVPELKKRAADVLFFLASDASIAVHPLKDSITTAKELQELLLFPVVSENRIGFFDQSGNQQISPLFTDIAPLSKCTLSTDSWVFVETPSEGQIVSKNGSPILHSLTAYEDLSKGIGLVKQEDSWYLYHKSGFKIIDSPVQTAEVLSAKWIKVKQNEKWGLVSYLGLQIAESIYDDIFREGSFWIFEKDDLFAVYTEALILDEIEQRGLSLEFKFDDIELVNENALIGFRDERECLLDSTLHFLIPWGEYEIYPEASGWYLRAEQGYRLYNQSEQDLMDKYFPYLESNDGWLAIKTDLDWMLLPRKGSLLPSREYDSIKLLNDHAALAIKGEEKHLMFNTGNQVSLKDEKITTLSQPHYVSVVDVDETFIYNERGEVAISGRFEKTNFLNDSLVKVQVRGKQGLMHTNGNWILNPVFDSIDEKDGLVLTLIDGKIGCYDPVINELIETGYQARLVRFGQNYLAKKEGKFGIIDYASQEVLSFSYDEVMQWNDTTYLVKDGQQYWVIDENEDPVYEPFESMRVIVENDLHSVYRFIKNGRYGLISNRFGELLKPEFTDIFNIGTEASPLFFSDQHLDKAGFHVVSYVDQKGKLILSKAYTREEFDQILCDD